MSTTTTAADRVAARASLAARHRTGVASVRYWICLLVLLLLGLGMNLVAEYLGVQSQKSAVPLKAPLTAFDWRRLLPYEQHPIQSEPLKEEEVQALGTEEYLKVRLIDPTKERSDRTYLAELFVTYYTGTPDLVPHVPDECYLAGGYDVVGKPAVVDIPVADAQAPDDKIPVRVIQFRSREGSSQPTVMYFFHVNGKYKATRDDVRLEVTTHPFERYGYYAKIEVRFGSLPRDARLATNADRAESIEALGPLLQRVMPVLLEDHFAWERRESPEWRVEEGRWVRDETGNQRG